MNVERSIKTPEEIAGEEFHKEEFLAVREELIDGQRVGTMLKCGINREDVLKAITHDQGSDKAIRYWLYEPVVRENYRKGLIIDKNRIQGS